MKGRKPLPRHLKLVKGNPGRRPVPPEKIAPKVSLPNAPDHLSDEAKAEWHRVIGGLFALKLMTDLDVAALSAYCAAYATWKMATTSLGTFAKIDPINRGLVIRTSNGNMIQNPLVGIANKAATDMVKFAAEFGMTPSARARIEQGGFPDATQDPSEEYFG